MPPAWSGRRLHPRRNTTSRKFPWSPDRLTTTWVVPRVLAETERDAALGEPYQSLEQQHQTAEFGMWIFLATELMLFGGLFTAYMVYRIVYPAGFSAGSHLLDLAYAAPNTVVLLVSSLTMALAVRASQLGRPRALVVNLLITAILGILFMGIKVAEYAKHIQ